MTNSFAVIGGSGIDKFESWSLIETREIETRFGSPSAAIEIYRCGHNEFYFLARHGRPHRIAPHCINYRANLRALSDLNVCEIIAINAVGGITDITEAGRVIIPDQIVDYTYGREHTFYAADTNALEHIDFTQPYSSSLRTRLLDAAKAAGVTVIDGGVYGATQGPRLESAAEIRRLERDGCDIVGMTGMPEAALARELGVAYASLCIVVNPAAGKGSEPLMIEDMHRAMSLALIDVEKILQAIFLQKFLNVIYAV